jgi:hypothetical protein
MLTHGAYLNEVLTYLRHVTPRSCYAA